MFIIFDLDDTLIDTSGSIMPPLIKEALKKMVTAGLKLGDFDKAYDAFLQINRSSFSSRGALKEFAEIFEIPSKFINIAEREILAPEKLLQPVQPVDSAIEILDALSHDHQLALVSFGRDELQREKMEKAGIPFHHFAKMWIHPPDVDGKGTLIGRSKKLAYQNLLDEFGVAPSHVIVCGDRIALDLTPAKELGITTVHFRWGRGLGNTGFKSDVDYTIVDLEELLEVVKKLELSARW